MKKVLLPIDGSECALRGVALVIAKRANYRDPTDLDIHLVTVQTPFSHDISRFASHDQIVMGTHGRGALKDFFMGSITQKVVHLSKIPVLLVK